MKVLLASDIHQYNGIFHGVDESKNFAKFLEVVKNEQPDLTLICGDLGEDISDNDIKQLKSLSKVFIIIGNHDNVDVIKRSGVFLDGLKEVNGITIAGINGIVAPVNYNDIWKFSYEELFDKANEIVSKLNKLGKNLDILLTHEMPKTKQNIDEFHDGRASPVFGDILYLLKPKLAVSGHLHSHKTVVVDYEHGTFINLGAFSEGHYAIAQLDTNPFNIKGIITVDLI